MKKLINILRFISEGNFTKDERINKMMTNVFFEKTTFESIELFEEFKRRFEQELKKRNLDAQIESSDIEAHFRQTKQIEVTNPQIL